MEDFAFIGGRWNNSGHGMNGEKTPAQKLAETFNVTRGAMTEYALNQNWFGRAMCISARIGTMARRKMVAISPAGRNARDHAIRQIPV